MTSELVNSNICLGFIGLGSIGLPIASNLVKAGFRLRVHTRSRKAELSNYLIGAVRCPTPQETAKGCDLLLICVTDDDAVESVLFGANGAQNSLKTGAIVIDLSTISPEKAKQFAKKLSIKGITYLDAPVTGGTEGAKEGTLSIFLGGNKRQLKEIEPILKFIGTSFYPFGSVGKGQEVKAINQVLVAGTYAAVAEGISLGECFNLPMDMLIEALQKGAASSWALKHRSKAMIKNEYPLGFKLSLHHKDLCIALNAAKEAGLELPISNRVKEMEEELITKGHEGEDISVLKRFIS